MRNQETVKEFREAYEALVATRPLPEKTEFEIQDLVLTKEHMFQLDGINLSETATRQVLNILKVKNDFPVIADEIGDSDFNVILNLLKTARSEHQLVGNITFIANSDGSERAPRIETILVNRNHESQTTIHTEMTMLAIAKAITESEVDYRLGAAELDRKNTLTFSFWADDEPIDVFNTGYDTWNVGYKVSFNENEYNVSPIYERLICSNGMTSVSKGRSTNIAKNNFNEERIYKITHRVFRSVDKIAKDLVDQTNFLKSNTLSLYELGQIKKRIENLLMEVELKPEVTLAQKSEISDSIDFAKYDNIYHCEVAKKSWRWKTTANSGVNAYDMLNQITNIATHLVAEVSTPIEFNILAASLFFKEEYDLAQVAGFAEVPEMKNSLMA